MKRNLLLASALLAGFASSSPQAADGPGVIANNDSIFVDGRTFKVTPGKATGDAAAQIEKLRAREMGPGALIFRSGDKLFIVEAPLAVPASGSTDGRTISIADEERPNRILIDYVPPEKPEHQKLLEMLKERRALEALQQIFSPFRMPFDLTLRTLECGMVNAWFGYENSRPTITVCYEYLQAIMANVPQETTAAGITRADAAIGQFFYVAVHELGHALFSIYDVPVFGREEDAADQFAAFVILQFDKERARRLVGGAAYSFKKHMAAFKENPNVTLPMVAFSSTHGQPEERYYNLLCTAYGADPELFGFLVEDQYLPKTRAPSCMREFGTLAKAFGRTISPHVDRELAGKVLRMQWLALSGSRPQ